MRVRIGQRALQMATGRGVFAKGGLDAGSRLLLQSVLPTLEALPEQARVCDLGCGWGALGCFIAAQNPSTPVLMCDINARAAWLAQFNARQNNLDNAHVWCGNGLGAVRDEAFDVVVCNPPIRAGNQTIGVLFDGAHRTLKSDGVLWAVIRTAQGAKSWQKRLETLFGNCETVLIKDGYRILKSEKA